MYHYYFSKFEATHFHLNANNTEKVGSNEIMRIGEIKLLQAIGEDLLSMEPWAAAKKTFS